MVKLIGGVITVGLVFLLATLFVGTATVRYDLITVHPAFWLFTLGIVFVIGGGWLASAAIPGGKLFATLGTGLLLLGGYKAVWPNTSAATAHAQEVADIKTALAINRAATFNAIRCDRESGTKFWDPVTGKPIVYYALNKSTQRLECADLKGFDPVTRLEFKAVCPEIVELILNQDAPTPAATPLPNLGEGLISEIRR